MFLKGIGMFMSVCVPTCLPLCFLPPGVTLGRRWHCTTCGWAGTPSCWCQLLHWVLQCSCMDWPFSTPVLSCESNVYMICVKWSTICKHLSFHHYWFKLQNLRISDNGFLEVIIKKRLFCSSSISSKPLFGERGIS